MICCGYRSLVFFRDSTIATLKMIKDDDEDDNLGTALDVVVTHIKKDCSMMDYKHKTYRLDPTKHGWYHPEGSAALSPTIVPSDSPLAPA